MRVVVINGKAGTGKDTFVAMCQDILGANRVMNISTVDFVKEVATFCGWNGSKTPKNRKFLSDLKDLLTEWEDVPFMKIYDTIRNWSDEMDEFEGYEAWCNSVIFIHCREPKEIKKLVDEFDAVTLLIRRDAAEYIEQINHADNEVLNYTYDTTIVNNGSLEDLRHSAEYFLRECLELKF
jgi:dephospho-CoA kinase